ncbi:MAG: alginate lyase family protein [Ewingella sp.]
MKLSALPFPLTLRRYTLLALLCTPWLTNAADFCSPSPDRNSPAATSLLRSVDAHLANNPDALPHLHTEGTLLHRGIRDVHADGSVFDFYERDALHYVVYDLEPLTMAALAAARGGQHWSYLGHGRGGNLAQALDWLVSYADGRKTHQEYQHSSVPFDAARREAGEHGFSGPWAAKSSQGLYWMASHLDSKYKPLAQQLAHNPPTWLTVCWPE